MSSEKLNNIYIIGIKFLVFTIPFLPLYISSSLIFPYIEGRTYAFRIIVEAAAVLWMGLLVLDKRYRPENSPLFITVLIFTFIAGLANLTGVNPYKSFWSNYERMEGYITILHLALYFLIARSVLKVKKDWLIFLGMSVIAGTGGSLYALYHRIIMGFPFREAGTIGHPTFFASYLLLVLFAALLLFINARSDNFRNICLSAMILFAYVIYLTAARGPFIAAFCGVIIFSLFYVFGKSASSGKKPQRALALSVIVICFILSAVFLLFYKTPETPKGFVEFHETISRLATADIDTSIAGRLDAWKVAWEGIKEKPFLGWGQENFISVYPDNPVRYGQYIYGVNLIMDKPHNIIFEWLVNAGFLGLLAYLSIFGTAVYSVRSAYVKSNIIKAEAAALTTALLVYFVQNLSTFDTINTYIVFFGLLAFIDRIHNAGAGVFQKAENASEKTRIRSVVVCMIAFLAMSIVSYFINYKPMKESYLTNRIVMSLKNKESNIQKRREFESLIDDFHAALSLNTFGDTHVRLLMHSIADSILKFKLFDIKGAVKFVQATSLELPKIIERDLYNLNYWMTVINFYNAVAVYEPSFIAKAEKLIRQCMLLSPENEWPYFALAENFILKKEFENAVSTVKKVVDRNPGNDQLQIRLALTGILTSREDVLDKAMENVKTIRASTDAAVSSGRTPVFNEDELLVFANTAKEIKNYNRALQFYKELIKISPSVAQYHYDAADIYYSLGDRESAWEEARKAAEIDPANFESRTDKFRIPLNN
ncbi:MAG: hypothetical protein C4538_08675 [Nitrospiraceae bacterium]|nr:MAG: hypothetical protein C4538_08675 [Nitrospiraceae bacterium]